jgi:hypothetical protein
MSTFAEAYQNGLTAAQETQNNIEEIEAVLAELNESVKETSNGRIIIQTIKKSEVGSLPRFVANFSEQMKETREVVYGKEVMSEPTVPYYIVAIDTETQAQIPVAEYTMDKNGYPIRIKWSNQNNNCWDREALTQTLKEILADPTTGRIFLRLLAEQNEGSNAEY